MTVNRILLAAIGEDIAANVNNPTSKLDYYCNDDWLKDKDPQGVNICESI